MKNNRLTENQIKNLVKKTINEEQELDEILGGTAVGDVFQGVKGFFKGEGFNYFKYLSKIKNRSKFVINKFEEVQSAMDEFKELKPKIEASNFAPEKKQRLINLIDSVISSANSFFPQFLSSVSEINKISDEKLSNKRLDVIPHSKKHHLGKDLMKSKDEENLNKPELTDFNTKKNSSEKENLDKSKLTNDSSEKESNKLLYKQIADYFRDVNKPNQPTTTTTTTILPMIPNQRNKGDEVDSNIPGWDDTIKEEIKRFKNLIK